MGDIEAFYDQLAEDYPLIYADWGASVKEQATALNVVMRNHTSGAVTTVLDAACGIGTQAIGLAELGYRVTASDISQASLDKAAGETQRRGLKITYLKSDMRHVDQQVGGGFDVVLACDNALPHLLSETDILQALTAFHRSLRPGGLAVISARDYAGLPREGHIIHPRHVHMDGKRKQILFDVWDFDGEFYDLTLYVVDDPGEGPPITRALHGGRYYCIRLDRLQSLMESAGFHEVKQLDQAYFQPLLVGHR
jgi:SAM-dependent methyltransferase